MSLLTMTQNVNQATQQSRSWVSLRFGHWTLLIQPEGQQLILQQLHVYISYRGGTAATKTKYCITLRYGCMK
jgi:hypothetical protein